MDRINFSHIALVDQGTTPCENPMPTLWYNMVAPFLSVCFIWLPQNMGMVVYNTMNHIFYGYNKIDLGMGHSPSIQEKKQVDVQTLITLFELVNSREMIRLRAAL